MEGKLKHWNEDKGFGFISSNGAEDVFIHISALKKMKRRPVVGDIIRFQIHTDNNGKKRAINASIVGVAAITSGTSIKIKKSNSHSKKGGLLVSILLLAVAVGFYKSAYKPEFKVNPKAQNVLNSHNNKPSKQNNIGLSAGSSNFSCNGKKYCSEMTSCKEAQFYQKNCPATEMDGDNDGIPCEKQWCN